MNVNAALSLCFVAACVCSTSLVALRWLLSARLAERSARTDAHDAKLASVEAEAAKLAERVRVLEWRSSKP